MLAVVVFIRNRSCCAVPKSGTIPAVEFVPCKYPGTALAVDDKVASSRKDTTWAFPIEKIVGS